MIKRFSLSSIKNKFPRGRSALAGNVQYSLEIIAVAHAPTFTTSTSLISIYPWSSGFGSSKYADPAVLPTGTGYSVAFNPAGTVIAITTGNSPWILTYPWSLGFGTKYADPATLPTGNANDVAFSSTGNDIAVAHTTTPYISVYPWSAGFGTKYANPTVLPTSTAYGVTFF